MDSDQKKYEIAYLISPTIKEDEVFGEAGKITGLIQDLRGLIGHIEEPRLQKLAYSIKKHREAYFGWTRFTAEPEVIAELNKKLRTEKNVVRYLLVEAEDEPIKPRFARPLAMPAPLTLSSEEKHIAPSTPPIATPPEEHVNMEELDKRLEEILGK